MRRKTVDEGSANWGLMWCRAAVSCVPPILCRERHHGLRQPSSLCRAHLLQDVVCPWCLPTKGMCLAVPKPLHEELVLDA